MNIKDKIAIVTGASGGIGEATARLLSKKRAKLALVARSKEKLQKLSKELSNSFVIVCDMSIESEVKKMVKKVIKNFGGVDILINNAGRGYDAMVENIKIKNFRKIFDLDLVGPLIAMQGVIPSMRKRGEGAIVNISSGTALMALPNMAGYSSLKRALAGISLTAREELKKDKISVSVVYPFITATEFEKNTLRDGEVGKNERAKESKRVKESERVGEDGFKLPKADSAEFIAEKIVNAIKTGEPEIYAHGWMRR